jgi:peptidoglycan/LPS O-acetylase OafA/YrhL
MLKPPERWRPFAPYIKDMEKPVRGHIVELDSLRGVAALIVVFDHFTRFWLETPHPSFLDRIYHYPPLYLLVNGHSSVMMFFLLSGFVLTLPQLSGKAQPYPIYATRRICRIYLPYLAAVSLAALGCWHWYGAEMYGHEFHLMWRSAPDLRIIAQHLLFVGKYNVFAYDPPIWSLVHEMRISLIFPILSLISLRLRGSVAFAFAWMFPLAATVLENIYVHPAAHFDPALALIGWLRTLSFCGIFLLGSLMARHEDVIRHRFTNLWPTFRWFLLLPALAFMEYPDRLHLPVPLSDFTVGLGAAYILVVALMEHGWLSRFLRLKPLQFLGRVSYSLYLLHLPILIVLSIAAYRKIPYGYLLPVFVALSLMAAAVFYRWVEQPSMQLGRLFGYRPVRTA